MKSSNLYGQKTVNSNTKILPRKYCLPTSHVSVTQPAEQSHCRAWEPMTCMIRAHPRSQEEPTGSLVSGGRKERCRYCSGFKHIFWFNNFTEKRYHKTCHHWITKRIFPRCGDFKLKKWGKTQLTLLFCYSKNKVVKFNVSTWYAMVPSYLVQH